MARTMMEIPFAVDQQTVETAVRGVLVADKYKEIDYNGETVWKMGTGLATAMHFIKTEYAGQTLRLYGWVQIGVGSAGGKERDLTGVVGAIPKKSVKKTMEKIRAVIS